MFLHYKNQYCENDSTTKAIYRFNEIRIKLPMAFFTELEQKILQFVWKWKTPQISSTLAWKIPWVEEPGGLQSMGSLRVGHD